MSKVIDTNVLIHGRGAQFSEAITVPDVLEEVVSNSAERSEKVINPTTFEPSDRALEKVHSLSSRINSPTSETDEKLVALALERNVTVVSDDKAVQNLAKHLEVDFEGFVNQEIEESREWKMFCPSCGEEKDSRCSRCGQEPIRRRV